MKKNLLFYLGVSLGIIICVSLVYYIFLYHQPLSTSNLGIALNAENSAYSGSEYRALIKDLDARQIGVVQLFVNWGDLETKRGTYDWSILDKKVDTLYKSGKRVSVDITLIDGQNIGKLPADFIYIDLYNQALRDRFGNFLQVFGQRYKNKVQYLELGREVDRFLLEQPEQLGGFNILYNTVTEKLREKNKNLKISTLLSYDYSSQTGNLTRLIKEDLGIKVDFLAFTFFNIDMDHQNLALSKVSAAFQEMLSYSKKSKVVVLTGFSDKNQQADFVKKILELTDQEKEKIEFMAYTPLSDPSGEYCTGWAQSQLWGQYQFSPECLQRTVHEEQCQPTEILPANVKTLADWYCTLGLEDGAGRDAGGWDSWLTNVKQYKF